MSETREARYRAIALDAIAAWQGEDDAADGPHKRGRSAQTRARLRARMTALDAEATPEPERPVERCAKCGEPAKEHGPFGFRDHAPVDANGDEIATDEPEWEGAAERCVDMGALDALLAYGHDECDSALRDQRREDYVQWSGWVDALERLKAQSGKPLSVEEDTHAGE